MATKILRVNVASIEVKSNGDPPKTKAKKKKKKKDKPKNNAITAHMKYPRSGAANVTSKIDVDLKDGQLETFDLGDFWVSGLFKEELYGETILTIQVTDRDEIGKLDRYLAKFFGAVVGAGLGLITGGISNTIVGAVVNLPVAAIKGSFVIDSKERIDVIGEAKIKLSENAIPDTLILDLKAPKTIKKTFYDFEKPGSKKVVKKEKVIIKEGQNNGRIQLRLALETA